MANDPAWAFQTAIYEALTSNAGVKAQLGDPARVYDHVPDDAVFPFTQLGDMTSVDWSTKTTDGQEQTITLHTWSRYRGLKEIKQAMGAIYSALHNATLAVDGQTLVLLQFDFADTFVDDDGETRHGVQRFRALLQSA